MQLFRMKPISCSEFEELLADHIDGTLTAQANAAYKSHMSACESCATLAQDAQTANVFLATTETPVAAPWVTEKMVETILRNTVRAPGLFTRFMVAVGLARVWAPRLIMGLSMAALSLVMINRFWDTQEKGVYRAWDRTVKNYENMQLVSSVQNQWEDWIAERNLEGVSK